MPDWRARGAQGGFYLAAVCLLVILKIGLRLAPYRSIAKLLPEPGARPAPGWVKTRVARAIDSASRVVPSATCLPQAMAGSLLLSLQGYASTLRIGVAPDAAKPFRAHAWLVCGADVIVGGDENLPDFRILTDLRSG